MAAHIRFSSSLLLTGFFIVATPAAAEPPTNYRFTDADRAIATATHEFEKDALRILGSDWLERAKRVPEAALEQAKQVHEESREHAPFVSRAKQIDRAGKSQYDTLIFISYSLDEATLKDILAGASGEERTALVMRGIPEGMRLWDGVAFIQKLASEFNPVPNIVLDPTLFQKYSVVAVPTIVALSSPAGLDENTHATPPADFSQSDPTQPITPAKKSAAQVELARVEGLADPTWLRRRIRAGELGDHGVKGPVVEIAERDLIEVMKERILAIDWEQKKEKTKERYWQGQNFVHLPRALKEETRYIDASVIATSDIRTSQGDFVARAGDRVNPLKTRAWTQAVVVFDPLDEKQMELLQVTVPELEADPKVAKVVLIATQFDKEKGWDSYQSVTHTFQNHIYQLTPDVRERFHLRYTPSVITANDTHFIVRELAVSSSLENQ